MIRLIIVSLATIALAGCLVTRDQVRDSVKPAKNEPLTQEQQKKASEVVKTQEYDEVIRQLQGRIEVLENSVGVLNADKTGSRVEGEAARKSQEEKLKIYEEAITKLEERVNQLTAQLIAVQTAQAATGGESKKSSPSNKSTFDQAEGEFSNKKWKEAIVGFEKYRTNNPSGKRYAEATYKIGSAFHELGMRSEAKAFYSEVVEKYPNGDWAKKAQSRLKALK